MGGRLLIGINIFEYSCHFITSKDLANSLTHRLLVCTNGPQDQMSEWLGVVLSMLN